jgi:hypothetical protein
MTKFMGISGKQMTSIGFLLAVLLITLSLGSLTFLINDNAATLPNFVLDAGLEGNCNRNEGMSELKKMDVNMKNFVKNTKNAPVHSIESINK